MALFSDPPIRTLQDLRQFEAAMPLEQRLTERSVLDVFIGAAARQPERTAITMLMTGAPDEQPRRVTYAQLLGLVRRSANLFHSLGGPRPGVAYMLPSLIVRNSVIVTAQSGIVTAARHWVGLRRLQYRFWVSSRFRSLLFERNECGSGAVIRLSR